jgi:hypothetical protein
VVLNGRGAWVGKSVAILQVVNIPRLTNNIFYYNMTILILLVVYSIALSEMV